MAFKNELFPNPKLLHGLKKKYFWPTQVVTNGSVEYRITKQSAPRREWLWQARAMSKVDIDVIILFLRDKKMMLDSFRFYCPFEKQEFHVRFNQNTIESNIEAMNSDGEVIYSTLSDFSLIEVFE